MRILIITLFVGFMGMSLTAQIKTPQASPSVKIEQQVGLTDVTLEYSRPSMKGRTIFGDLVPMNKLWRLGANANTKMTFSTDVTVGGKDLKKGTYAVFATPSGASWDIFFYTDSNNGGTPEKWEESKVAATVKAKSTKLPISMETFTILLGGLTNNSADVQIIWENTMATFELGVPTKETVEKNIAAVMAGPSNRDYYNAAGFYLDEKMNLEAALEYINKSISMDYERFWSVRRKALIQAELGKYRDAIKTAEKSIELAKEAGNDDYVNNNMKSIAMWKKMK